MNTDRCGTSTGYRRHIRAKHKPCDPCRVAQAEWQRQYRKRTYLNRGRLMVDATGTQRRLQALARLGWSWVHVGAEFGVSSARISAILSADKVRLDTARKVVRLYDRWSMALGPSTHARNRAIAKGWVTALDWEGRDMDDPRVLSHSQHGALVRQALEARKAAAA